MSANADVTSAAWLMMIHQIPPKPDYLRVKIGRRLARVGAVAVKNSVYVLPDGDQPLEDFQWIRREIIDGGGDATICRASLVDGLSDDGLRDAFRAARDADYAEIAAAAREMPALPPANESEPASRRTAEEVARLRKRFAAVAAIDFFEAKGRSAALEAIERAGVDAASRTMPAADAGHLERATYRARTWVTRKGIFVDRMASAWLIRRFIDPDARFRFVDADHHRPTPGELRFDMFEGEFTHAGDRCTFEVLLDRFALRDAALRAIAEVVHDIDLRDEKFGRDDAAGVERALSGIAQASGDDHERAERSHVLFDALHAAYAAEAGASAVPAPPGPP